MKPYSLRLPDFLMARAKELAAQDGASLNQFITLAIAEKLSALDTARLLSERAGRADLSAFRKLLDRVPAGPVVSGDELL